MNLTENSNQIPNITRVGRFEKVSFPQFYESIKDSFGEKWSDEEVREFYDNIKLPARATRGSAGYDFFSPIPFKLEPWEEFKIPLGLRAFIDDGWFLTFIPRSGHGFKHFMRFANVFPCVDSDYVGSSNEGHMWAKIRIEKASGSLTVNTGDAFIQGLFIPFGVTYDDAADGVRDGGFGSTTA